MTAAECYFFVDYYLREQCTHGYPRPLTGSLGDYHYYKYGRKQQKLWRNKSRCEAAKFMVRFYLIAKAQNEKLCPTNFITIQFKATNENTKTD
jgi:hypothetical protein